MNIPIRFFLFAILALIPVLESNASVLGSCCATQPKSDGSSLSSLHFKSKKAGPFSQIWAIRYAQKLKPVQGMQDEKSSKLARFAIILFAVSYASTALIVVLPFWGWLCLAGFLLSNILAIIILFKEKNRKSRKIARIILIISGSLIALSALLLWLLIRAFSNQE